MNQAGLSVAIIERHLVGGTCVNTGCRPTKTLVASAAGDRLLVFAELATAENAAADAVDIRHPEAEVAVAARDVPDFDPDLRADVDTNSVAFPAGFASHPPANTGCKWSSSAGRPHRVVRVGC